MEFAKYKQEFTENGFVIINNVFSDRQIKSILNAIEEADISGPLFRKTQDLFAIRQFLKALPVTVPLIFTELFNSVISGVFGENYFVAKSIYFDKPGHSNWFVSYHQDLTISVDKKIDVAGFGPWSVKQNQYAVQPPIEILERNFTVRIHLDETNENNGALKIIPKSHLKGICRPETIDWKKESEAICSVPKGGIMIMSPLLLHASSRTTNNQQRRVIHIEFSNSKLPESMMWSEYLQIPPLNDHSS